MLNQTEFRKFAVHGRGLNGLRVDQYLYSEGAPYSGKTACLFSFSAQLLPVL